MNWHNTKNKREREEDERIRERGKKRREGKNNDEPLILWFKSKHFHLPPIRHIYNLKRN